MPVKNNNRAARGKNRKAGNSPRLSAEEERLALAKQFGIKTKTREFIDLLNDNPKLSATDAYLQVHKTTNRKTAGTGASKLLKKPAVIGYKDSAVGKAKRRIVSLVDSSNESIALKASADIIDRNEGKAVQKNETLSKSVTVSLDLTGVRIGAHYIKAEDLPTLDAN